MPKLKFGGFISESALCCLQREEVKFVRNSTVIFLNKLHTEYLLVVGSTAALEHLVDIQCVVGGCRAVVACHAVGACHWGRVVST
jgi:hypothetical protein